MRSQFIANGERQHQLTKRERQILELLCEGLPNKTIARKLNIKLGTVKVHLHNMFQKFDVMNRTELAMKKGGTKGNVNGKPSDVNGIQLEESSV